MSNRFTQLYSIEPNQYQAGAPVLIVAGVLFKDTVTDKVLVLLKMRSLSLKKIKAVSVIIQPFDTIGRKLGDAIPYQYLDLQINRADVFGQKIPVFMEEKITRQFSVLLKEVAFADNSVWEADNADTFTIKEPLSLYENFHGDDELVKQYKYEYGFGSNVFPKEEGGLWFCNCGEINTSAEIRCYACGNEKEKLFSFDLSELEKKKEERKNAESYENAVKLKNKRTKDSLIKAVSAFKQLGDYKDSAEQIIFCEAEIEIVKAEEEKKRKEEERKRKEEEEKRKAEEERRKAEKERLLEEERQAKLKKERARRKVRRAVIIALAFVAFCIVLITVILPAVKLNKAKKLIDSGDYEAAFILLNGMNYQDSKVVLNSIRPEYEKILLSKAQVGSEVIFGTYEQDNNTSNGEEDIEWLVLEKDDNKALLISKYALDSQQYNKQFDAVTWEKCSLRKWLNENFLNAAFSEDEQAMLPGVTVSADGAGSGRNTTDQVFLLSTKEANEYFSSDSERKCKGTEYCFEQGSYKNSDGICWWWLRSAGSNNRNAAGVDDDGSVSNGGGDVSSSGAAVRPAVWIDFGS